MSEGTKNWMVYKHTSPSGKVYIGISKNSPVRRWGRNGNNYKKERHFWNAIQKYGWNNIQHEILLTGLNKSNANYAESYLIRWYKLKGISYNITDGGEGTVGWHPSKELKERWSRERKGRVITSEWREKLSKALKGRKISRSAIEKGVEEMLKKCSKKVVQLSLNGKYINTYNSIREASRNMGQEKCNSSIGNCYKNKAISAKGYFWMYKSDYDNFVKNGSIESTLNDKINRYNNRHKYKRTDTLKNKLSQRFKGITFTSPEHMNLLKKIGPEAAKKHVLQLTIDNKPVAVFESAVEIKERLGFSCSSISICCNGKKDKAHGYKWKFISNKEYNEYEQKFAV